MQSPPFPRYLLGPYILLNTIFSNTLSFLSSRNVSDQVSHPYKTVSFPTDHISTKYNMIHTEVRHYCHSKAPPPSPLLFEHTPHIMRYHYKHYISPIFIVTFLNYVNGSLKTRLFNTVRLLFAEQSEKILRTDA